MEVIAMVLVIVLMILGYYLMDKIDVFLAKNSSISQEYQIDKGFTLIFADPDSNEFLSEIFERLKFSWYLIDNSYIPKNLRIDTFFALSSDDSENLFMSRLIKIKTENVWIVARVNEHIYSDLYRKSGVDRIIVGNITTEKIIESLKGGIKA